MMRKKTASEAHMMTDNEETHSEIQAVHKNTREGTDLLDIKSGRDLVQK